MYKLASKYFGGWDPSGYVKLPSGGAGSSSAEALPRPQAFLTGGARAFEQAAVSGPTTLLGYYRPPLTSDEGIVLEVLSDVLTGGRTARWGRGCCLAWEASTGWGLCCYLCCVMAATV